MNVTETERELEEQTWGQRRTSRGEGGLETVGAVGMTGSFIFFFFPLSCKQTKPPWVSPLAAGEMERPPNPIAMSSCVIRNTVEVSVSFSTEWEKINLMMRFDSAHKVPSKSFITLLPNVPFLCLINAHPLTCPQL